MGKASLNEAQAVIWDLDGTLLDSYDVIVTSVYEAYLESGIDLDKREIYEEVKAASVNDFISKMEESAGVAFDTAKSRYYEVTEREKLNIKAEKDAAEILQYMKDLGIPNLVFTHRGKSVDIILKNAGLYDYFDEVLSAGNGIPRKPDPAGILYLVDKYGLDKEKTFYVGDRSLDIESADNAGIKSILLLPEGGGVRPAGKETFIVKALPEIKKLIGKTV